jgi:tetratricopeptide (TPR) repeat protein
MARAFQKAALGVAALLLLTGVSFAQTGTIEGRVIGDDGKPLPGAQILIERTDIKGNYKVKTNKKGEYLHAGLPLGQYNVSVEIGGKVVDSVNGVRTRLGENVPVEFNLQQSQARQQQLAEAAQEGTLTDDQTRGMSPEQKAALEKAMKEREAAMRKNKELNEAFTTGMTAMKSQQYDVAAEALKRASEMDATQHVVWVQLADAYSGLAAQKTGAESQAAQEQAIAAYQKALELKPDDAAYFNNYGIALAKAKKVDEAQEALGKAAELDPTNAGKYFYNLGAILTNMGQTDGAGEAFRRAIEANPNYAEAQYQYGIYLVSKAQVGADGSVTPAEGTREAFAKYLELQPNGPFAESARSMLDSLQAGVQTQYENPDAKGAKRPAQRKK